MVVPPQEPSTTLDVGLEGFADSGWNPIGDHTHLKVHVDASAGEKIVTIAWSDDAKTIVSSMLHVNEANKACAIEGKRYGDYYRLSAAPKATNIVVNGGA